MSGTVMVCSYIICWSPYFSFGLLYVFNPIYTISLPVWFPMLLRAFGHMHCSLNPVIYGYLAVKMFQRRRELQHTAIRRRKMQQVSNVIYYASPENTVLGF